MAVEAYFGSARSSGTTWAARHGRLHLPRPLSAFADRLLLPVIACFVWRKYTIRRGNCQVKRTVRCAALSGCRKNLRLFSTARNNVVIFVPPCGTKIVASRREASTLGVLHARLARQGFARHLIRFEAGFAPSSSPCVKEPLTPRRGFIDKQKGRRDAPPFIVIM